MSQGNSLQTLSGLQRLLEGGLIICCMTATYILLALSSFDPNDPGWSQSHFQVEINNLTGAVGAWTADVLFYFLGFIAFLIPIIIASTGWFVFNRTHKLFEIDYFSVGLRIIGFLLMVFALAALASMNAEDIYVFSAGGVAGDVISQAMLPYFNNLGTTLLLLCFIGAGFTLTTGISWLTIIESTGLATIWCIKKIISIPSYFSGSRETEDTRGFMTVVDKFKQDRQLDSEQDKHTVDSDEAIDENTIEIEEEKPSIFARIKSKLAPSRTEQESDFYSDSSADNGSEKDENIDINLNTESNNHHNIDPDTATQAASDTSSVASNGRIEPKIMSANVDDVAEEVTPPWVASGDAPAVDFTPVNHSEHNIAQTNTNDPLDEAFDQTHSTGALTQSQQQKVAPKAPEQARIVEGVVILPGQEPQLVYGQSQVEMPPLPSITLLDVPNRKENPITREELDVVARLVETKLADFNIVANVVGVFPGPVVTRFELELAPGIKASKITNLSKDLARSLLAESVRVVEVIPGKAFVGLELPNKFRETVFMRDVLDSKTFEESKSDLSMVLGQDIAGDPVVVDLGKMPHLLVAGTTGSGKSVGVNVMITSILYKSGPDDVRFIMIDPKMLELSVYGGIPHLLCEVVTDMKEAANALRWCVGEMERRYKLMSALGVRNLKGYNTKIRLAKEAGEPIVDPLWKSSESMDEQAPELEKLPSIVVVVDEFADMIMIVGKKVEELIARIAQKARAAGIHLILATQRPSVDVITGLIKANVPTRIAFQVSSRIDSRTILDQQGAETLLGMGDMLYLPPGTSVPIRVHGAFIDDHEVHKVVADWHARGKPRYIEEILNGVSDGEQVLLPGETSETEDETDQLYDEAVAFVTETRRGSISSVQRKFKIGYNRAARIIEMMESQGIVSTQGHNGNREVLAPPPPRN
ncbi:DNA translocase FtsK [Shewanella donghaensis]|uniref:DNA translocase FtsK n=1 Tax=Shewanella donghaensis TaxID=238836 RepID=UPI0011829FC9|nr:DNA translocase FtsK [Shewanella donghaensis]